MLHCKKFEDFLEELKFEITKINFNGLVPS